MTEHTKWSTLKAELLVVTNDIMNNEVATVIKEQISKSVEDVVYAAGEPMIYQRRNLINGSLGDPSVMNHTIEGNTLIVTDDADYNSQYDIAGNKTLAYNIEKGYGDRDEWWKMPRPFIKNTMSELIANKRHVIAMKKGLRRYGLDSE
jgi:hypothetical protein